MSIKKLFFTGIVLSALVLPSLTLAQTGGTFNEANSNNTGGVRDDSYSTGGVMQSNNDSESGVGTGLQNPLEAESIAELFQVIIDILMIFAIPIIVFFIVYAGFLYVTARGSAEKIQQAHRALLYAIIGALLIIGANVLIDVVGGTVDSVTGGNTDIIR